MTDTGSQQVSFWEVHQWVERFSPPFDFPICGGPEWVALPDDDPQKLAAALDFTQHYALRLETEQEQRAQASQAVASAANWPDIARQYMQRRTARSSGAYIPRKRSA